MTFSSSSKVAIFPATGGLGGSTLNHLASKIPATQIVAVVRYPNKVPSHVVEQGVEVRQADYDDEKSLEHAFDGVDTLNLISYVTFAHELRTKLHKLAINAAIASGVNHIIYSSLAFASSPTNTIKHTSLAHVMQAHLDTEKYLSDLAAQDSKFTYTIVRIGLYSESFPIYTGFFNLKSPTSEIVIPHDGSGPGVAWAKRDELGEGVAVLIKTHLDSSTSSQSHKNKTLLLSGLREYSLKETVEVISRVTKTDVKIREVSVEEYAKQKHVQKGLGKEGDVEWAKKWATAWGAIKDGEAAGVTNLLKETLGREPEGLETTLKAML